MIEQAGYHGIQEVEIFSEDWWSRPGDEVLATAIDRFERLCQPDRAVENVTPAAAAAR
jgi:hypothetical protein